MKKIYTIIVFCLIVLLSIVTVDAQVDIDAEHRPRTEFRQGFNQPLADSLKAGFASLQRTRLNFNYTSSILNARITLQDSRVFGETSTKQPASATSGSIGIYEAWSELLLFSGTRFKIGRQEIQFEDGRLFSSSPWSNTGNSHDLMQLKYNCDGFSTELGYAFNNQNVQNVDSSFYNINKTYKQLAFFHVSKSLLPGLEMSLLEVSEGFNTSKANLDLYYRNTLGGTVNFKKDHLPLTAFLTAYYQSGKSSSTIDLSAYLLALKTTFTFTPKIKLTAGFDFMSGSESTLEAGKTHTFNKLPYATNHAFYGYMEYWGSIPKGGLVKYFVGSNFKLTEKLSSDFTWYSFNLDKAMTVASSEVKGNIGSELDAVFNYKVSPIVSVQFAWCSYFANTNTNILKFEKTTVATKFSQFAYLMFTIKPEFYSTLAVLN